ncbi:hypothetical protein EHS25_005684 [Saitozyma podzolica]|jgi:hypothetical protein|uniref:Uncharacterized protein n=1 Tax=Saitozyma podzolica TaxID=1890683 RepID=A0A427XW79_9TREE|nr:hypothetical protein EHS25_005684 [Saitozyma podzolica]
MLRPTTDSPYLINLQLRDPIASGHLYLACTPPNGFKPLSAATAAVFCAAPARLAENLPSNPSDYWVGESFDIGREFKTPPTPQEPVAGPSTVSPDEARHCVVSRPGNSRATTQESFLTARTEPSSTTSRNGVSSTWTQNGDTRYTSVAVKSEYEQELRLSGPSSGQPLIDILVEESATSETRGRKGKGKASEASLKGESMPTPKLLSRLTSALRKIQGCAAVAEKVDVIEMSKNEPLRAEDDCRVV